MHVRTLRFADGTPAQHHDPMLQQASYSGAPENTGGDRTQGGEVAAINTVAGSILESLKAGVPVWGLVLSVADGVAWVGIELAGIGWRCVAARCEQMLEPGQEVELRCVPNAARAGRYKFIVNQESEDA